MKETVEFNQDDSEGVLLSKATVQQSDCLPTDRILPRISKPMNWGVIRDERSTRSKDLAGSPNLPG